MSDLPPDLALVINLASAADRRAFQERQLAALGIPFRILSATAVADVDPAVMARLRRTWARPLRATEVCCTLSHRRAWQTVLDEGRPRLILEDDAVLSRHMAGLLQNLIGRRDLHYVTFESLGIAKLLARKRERMGQAPFTLARLYRDRGGAAAYLLWPDAAARLLKATEDTIPLADAAIDLAGGLIRHQVEPAAAVQAALVSSAGSPQGTVSLSLINAEDMPAAYTGADWLRYRSRRFRHAMAIGLRRLAACGSETRDVVWADDIGQS